MWLNGDVWLKVVGGHFEEAVIRRTWAVAEEDTSGERLQGRLGADHGWWLSRAWVPTRDVGLFTNSDNRRRCDHSCVSGRSHAQRTCSIERIGCICYEEEESLRGRRWYFQLGKTKKNLWHRRHVCLALAVKGQSYKIITMNGERKLPDQRGKFNGIRRRSLAE